MSIQITVLTVKKSTRSSYLPFVRQTIVVDFLVIVVFKRLSYTTDPLGWISKTKTLCEMSQVEFPPVEYLTHIFGVARVETDPGYVG